MFQVMAGKYDDNDLNCKHSVEHETLDAAIEDYDRVSSYPWAYIEYKGRILELWSKNHSPFAD